MSGSDEIGQLLNHALAQHTTFGELLTPDEKEHLVDYGAVISVVEGDMLCKQNECDSRVYLIVMGEVEVVAGESESEVVLTHLRRGEVFGEISALLGLPRTTTVRATMPSVLLEIDGSIFVEMITRRDSLYEAILNRYKSRLIDTALRSATLFRHLSTQSLTGLIEQANIISVPADTVMVKEGESGDSFYVIIRGKARVSHELGEGRINLAVLQPGGYFGEWALLTGAPRAATVTSLTRVDAVSIDKQTFLSFVRDNPELQNELDRVAHNRYSSVSRFGVPESQQQVDEMLRLIESVFNDNEKKD